MTLRTVLELVRGGQLSLLLGSARAMRRAYRLPFLGACVESGLLRILAAGPVPLERVRTALGIDPSMRDGLEAWLGLGVWLGELRKGPDGYALQSRLARRLAVPANDPVAAMIQEAGTLHLRLISETPARLRDGRWFTLADQDGALVARSSRAIEPFVGEAVDAVVPSRGPIRLFEIGCGTAIHIRRAAMRNPALTAVGVELQPEVASVARRNVAEWNLAARVAIELGDVRERAPGADFDVATLHNNIYYFPVVERPAVLRHVRGFLIPGGRLLLTTLCLGPGVATDVLNVWGAMTAGCGRLPGPDELTAQIGEAGFTRVERTSLIPGDSFYAFVGVA